MIGVGGDGSGIGSRNRTRVISPLGGKARQSWLVRRQPALLSADPVLQMEAFSGADDTFLLWMDRFFGGGKALVGKSACPRLRVVPKEGLAPTNPPSSRKIPTQRARRFGEERQGAVNNSAREHNP